MMTKFWNAGELVEFLGPDPGDRGPSCRGWRSRRARTRPPRAGARPARPTNGSRDEPARPAPTASPRTIDATTYAAKNSTCESGGSSTNTMLPVTFDWIRLDELLANAFCSIDIIDQPGHQERRVREPAVDLHATLENVAEDEQVQERRQHRRRHRLEAHLPEAQQLLVEERREAGPCGCGQRRRHCRLSDALGVPHPAFRRRA